MRRKLNYKLKEEELERIDCYLRDFIGLKRDGKEVNKRDVCEFAAREIIKENPFIPFDELCMYVGRRWNELYGEKLPSAAEKKRKELMEEWKALKPYGEKYVESLPEAPGLDFGNAARIANVDILSDVFKWNGRAFDMELSKGQRKVMRKLEDAGLVKMKRYEVKAKIRKGENKFFTIHYWEPTGKKIEEEAPKEEYPYNDELWEKVKLGGKRDISLKY